VNGQITSHNSYFRTGAAWHAATMSDRLPLFRIAAIGKQNIIYPSGVLGYNKCLYSKL